MLRRALYSFDSANRALRLCAHRRRFASVSEAVTSSPIKETSEAHERKRIYVTTPIFYVNGPPHIGHLYTALIGDAITRFHRSRGDETWFVTGTDEHGLKIQQAAEKNGMEPAAFCDFISRQFYTLFQNAEIGFDDYIRTTQDRHKAAVESLWSILDKNKSIYRHYHEGWYCVSDEAFLTESQVLTREKFHENLAKSLENNQQVQINNQPIQEPNQMVSIESGHPVEWLKEENYKFKLSEFNEKLESWLESNPQAIVPQSRLNEVLAFIRKGLEDISVSRPKSRIRWAIPAPNVDDQTIYVWLDALTNYLTLAGFPAAKESNYQRTWPPDYQIVGKDILRFHAIYWPAFLLAAGIPLPKRIVAHAHWTVEGRKMSKSQGTVVDPAEMIKKYGVDAVRYFLLREGGLANDGDFSEARLISKYNSELADSLGNLLTRCTGTSLNPRQVVPEVGLQGEHEKKLLDMIYALPGTVDAQYRDADISKALHHVMGAVAETNRYFSEREPWKISAAIRAGNASVDEQRKLDAILHAAMEALRVCCTLLVPVIPSAATSALVRLGTDPAARSLKHIDRRLMPGQPLGQHIGPLFPKHQVKAQQKNQ
eukprot:TRINITY_DN4760_c1_g1_i1.p1 TRINITY_DN4760_c1_g1~~TRINITY_DN4760_c1_g1_i1.p1  ORF type:complete len:598 (-),score=129.86 TRINITY_DN4760_c1_g1_i1:23-1816(-)